MTNLQQHLTIEPLRVDDIHEIAAAFEQLGWNKPVTQYENYLSEQQAGKREIRVARYDGIFAGYLTVVWSSHYGPFREANIPEVVDFNVLPQYRRQRIGTMLMDEAELLISSRSKIAGIGVGMYADYGPAQRLYMLRGYVPDARGIMYDGEPVPPGASTVNDDSLVLFFTKELKVTL